MTDATQAPPEPTKVEVQATALTRLHRLLVLVVAAVAVSVAIWLVSDVLVVVFAASLLAVILHGTSALLSRWTSLPHWASLLIVAVTVLALLVGLAVIAGPGLVEQASALRQALSGQATALHDRLAGTAWGRVILDQVPVALGGKREGGNIGVPSGVAGSLAGVLGTAFGLFGTAAVVVIAALYLAAAPSTYIDGGLRLVPERHRATAKQLAAVAGKTLWAWSAGQALDMLVVGVLSALGLWAIGVPLALVLGVLAGLLNFVPYIGALAGAVPAIIIAFSAGVTPGLETIALYVAIQGFEGNVMAPMIQRRAVDLPPGLTILSQTAFGAILGIPGLIFATPLTAAIMAVLDKATPPLSSADRAEVEE